MDDSTESALRSVAEAWDHAMVLNDAEAIGQFMSEEWVIVGSDGGMMDRSAFLELVRTGRLTHDVMTTDDARIRVYDDVALLVARGVSAGHFDGHAFREIERQSNVFVRREGVWRCVLTHLSRIAEGSATMGAA